MSNENKPLESTAEVDAKVIIEFLIKHLDIHEGFYTLAVNAAIGGGVFQTPVHPERHHAGFLITFPSFGLTRVPEDHPDMVDASKINPLKKTRKRKIIE